MEGSTEQVSVTDIVTIISELVYLQHCLDIDPSFYAKQFVTDVHVSDDLRKKYPYKPEEADKYRQKFVELSNQQQKKTQP